MAEDKQEVEKVDDGKVQISMRLYPSQLAAIQLYGVLTGSGHLKSGQIRLAVFQDAFTKAVEGDKKLKPFIEETLYAFMNGYEAPEAAEYEEEEEE